MCFVNIHTLAYHGNLSVSDDPPSKKQTNKQPQCISLLLTDTCIKKTLRLRLLQVVA